MQETSRSGTTESMLRSLVGDDCCWCTAGTLTRETFKGDDAVVCENCETPAVRVW
ncbi:HVO_A0556 family zinc finger protein [Halorussus amylolyticus]|uniref:HVO_A0556 family zinc finger protein n=1 Tax=Halorussus amylolyticus TaxID=1126242 RepID=UPI00138F667C|nr:HVO_A0556 family zinc finger protein [Halorussus amylolyticus]